MRENKISKCIVIAVDVCNTGPFGFVQNAEKIVQVACLFFLTETSNAENKAPHTVYMSKMQELARGHHLIFIHGTLPLT